MWHIEEVSFSSGCGTETRSYVMDIVGNGSGVTIYDDLGRSYDGTLDGSRIVGAVPFGYGEGGGMTTVSHIEIQLDGERHLSGESTWTWSDGFETCSGTSSFTGARI